MSDTAQPDFRELLSAQEPFLRRLACGLIASAVDRDEVVQDTLLAAWQSRGRSASRRSGTQPLQELGPDRVRLWLSTVLRRRVWMLHRKRRPYEALDPESLIDRERDSVEAISLRTERQSVLGNALVKLPEAWRDVIVLRYQDEMTVANIAERRGLSVNTVHSHLRRGQAELRRILEATSDAKDRADGAQPWLLTLMPLAFPNGAPAGLVARLGSPASVTAAGGAVGASQLLTSVIALALMKKLAILVGIFAVVGFFVQSMGPAAMPASPDTAAAPAVINTMDRLSGAEPVPVESATHREIPAQARIIAPDPAPSELSSKPQPSPAAERSITGRVLLMDGRQVPGAKVTATLDQKYKRPEYGTAITLPDGSFTLDLVGDDVPEQVMLEVHMSDLKSEQSGVVLDWRTATDVEIRLDAVMVRLVAPEDDSAGKKGSLKIRSSDRSLGISSYGRYVVDEEPNVTRLLPAGAAYSFCVTLRDTEHAGIVNEEDDLVAYLGADVPSGFYELSLGSDTPELGSFTVNVTGAALPAKSGAYLQVRLWAKEGPRGGAIMMERGSRRARKSGEFPGRFTVQAQVNGDQPAGWVIPEVVEPEVEIRAGEDTPIEVRLRTGGMIRLTIQKNARSSYKPSDSEYPLDVYYRRVGAERFEQQAVYSIEDGQEGKFIVSPVVDQPMMIDGVLEPGTYEVQLLNDEEVIGPVPVVVSGGQYCDVTIELP